MKDKYRKAVFIVVYRKAKNIFGKQRVLYLLLKRKKHWIGWEFPKGGIDKKESAMQTAIRETKEEVGQEGFNFKKYNYSGKYKYLNLLADRPGYIGQTDILFSAEVKNRKVIFDKTEHSGYKWVSLKKALKEVKFTNQKKALKLVDKGLVLNK